MSTKVISIDVFKPKKNRRDDLVPFIPVILTTAALLGGLGAVAAIGWLHGREERLDN